MTFSTDQKKERKKISHCPLCECNTEVLFHKNNFPIIKCVSCGFITVGEYPTEQEISNHYEQNYRQATENFYPKDRSRRWRSFWRATGLAPYIWNKSVLDLGCGGGQMANAMSLFSRSVTGIDISSNSIAFARKNFTKPDFQVMSLENLAESGMQFDFVFSSEVLEHLPGPDSFMKAVSSVTKSGGIVHLTAPEAGHAATPEDMERWEDICPPEHLQWFNKTNLKSLFEKYGFSQIKKKHTKNPSHSVFFQKNKD